MLRVVALNDSPAYRTQMYTFDPGEGGLGYENDGGAQTFFLGGQNFYVSTAYGTEI